MRGAPRQNFFLYLFGTLFNLGGVLAVMAGSRLTWAAVFRGHSRARARRRPARPPAGPLTARGSARPRRLCQGCAHRPPAGQKAHSRSLSLLRRSAAPSACGLTCQPDDLLGWSGAGGRRM